jgi:hypothetical protein
MHWLLQESLFSEAGFLKLLDALDRLALLYSIHKVVPFVGTLIPDPGLDPGRVIVMGSYSMAREAQRRGWQPGSFVNENLDMRVQFEHWGDQMLNCDSLQVPFSEVPRSPKFFLRPAEDTKAFAGKVLTWEDFEPWREKVLALGDNEGGTLSGVTPVIWAPLKEIHREFRLWIVNGKVVTGSLYKIGGTVRYDAQVDDGAIQFAETLAAKWSPISAYVMDVADTPDGYRAIEVNNLNSAGFYAADMMRLVIALEDLCD